MQPAPKVCLLRLKNEEKKEWLSNEYHQVKPVCMLWQNFAKKIHCWKICFQKLFWVALDVCVGKNQLGGDKRDKIANIGAVECRTCHRKLSKYRQRERLSTKKTAIGAELECEVCSSWKNQIFSSFHGNIVLRRGGVWILDQTPQKN